MNKKSAWIVNKAAAILCMAVVVAIGFGIGSLTAADAFAAQATAGGKVTYENLKTDVEVQTPAKTKISWKKKDVDKYVIYQLKDDLTRAKKVATFSGKKTSYTIKTKKNKTLNYEIVGNKYKKGTKTLSKVYRSYIQFYSGVAPAQFAEYNDTDANCSPEKIELRPIHGEGMKPDGFEIFRKKSGAKKFKKIKTITLKTLKKSKGSYFDKTVKEGQAYVYSLRTYKKIGKKIYYGPADEITLRTVNKTGKYTVKGAPDGDEPILKITSRKNNGLLVINGIGWGYGSQTDDQIVYLAKEYSADGETWISKGEIKVKAGESFWIRYEKTECGDSYDRNDYPTGNHTFDVKYNGVQSCLYIQPYVNYASAYYDGEAVH